MNEQQADYDSDTGDTQPTPGPWSYSKQNGESGAAFLVQVWGADGDSLAVIEPQHPHIDEATANARLIAAAGTAVSELPKGYDPVAALQELPRLLDALRTIARADGTRYAGTDALQHVAEKALDAIRTQSETND